MKNMLQLLFVLLGVMILTGVGSPLSANTSQDKDGLTATLSVDPDPPVAMQPATLTLVLEDAAGQAVRGAEIEYDLTMPAMPMPLNRPPVNEVADGRYRCEALFSMSGQWQVRATVKWQSETSVFDFAISVK